MPKSNNFKTLRNSQVKFDNLLFYHVLSIFNDFRKNSANFTYQTGTFLLLHRKIHHNFFFSSCNFQHPSTCQPPWSYLSAGRFQLYGRRLFQTPSRSVELFSPPKDIIGWRIASSAIFLPQLPFARFLFYSSFSFPTVMQLCVVHVSLAQWLWFADKSQRCPSCVTLGWNTWWAEGSIRLTHTLNNKTVGHVCTLSTYKLIQTVTTEGSSNCHADLRKEKPYYT